MKRKISDWGGKRHIGDVTCPKCARVWQKYGERIPVKELNYHRCYCGEVLANGKSVHILSFELAD